MADRERRTLLFAHQEWLGFVQPVGLVVAPTVMVDAQVVPDRNVSGRQRDFRELLEEDGSRAAPRWSAPDLRRLFLDYLGWDDGDLVDATAHREALEISLPELQVVLSSTWAVHAVDDAEAEWTMLVRAEEDGANLDDPPKDAGGWNATRHARFERLLRETGISIGLLCTDERIRLIYAPKGESSGHITFEFSQMAQPAGRPILAALDMLFSADALFGGSREACLPALLAKSREAQAEVSTRLSRQVLAALHELLRGFVAADARGDGTLTDLARKKPDHLYGGLITALMRMVFVLYAEDRGLMPDHAVYQQHYSLGGLFARLRADAAAWPDTMDQRFGAWAQLLSLFRLIHSGGRHAGLSFVARKGKAVRSLQSSPSWKGAWAGRRGRDPDGAGRDRLEGAAKPDGARRRAPLLPHARRRADRLGLRSHHGLPRRADHRPVHCRGLAQAHRRSGRRRSRSVGRPRWRQARKGASGCNGSETDRRYRSLATRCGGAPMRLLRRSTASSTAT